MGKIWPKIDQKLGQNRVKWGRVGSNLKFTFAEVGSDWLMMSFEVFLEYRLEFDKNHLLWQPFLQRM